MSNYRLMEIWHNSKSFVMCPGAVSSAYLGVCIHLSLWTDGPRQTEWVWCCDEGEIKRRWGRGALLHSDSFLTHLVARRCSSPSPPILLLLLLGLTTEETMGLFVMRVSTVKCRLWCNPKSVWAISWGTDRCPTKKRPFDSRVFFLQFWDKMSRFDVASVLIVFC